MLAIFSKRSFYSVALSALLSILFVASVAYGATTISTNISTGGTLTVSGVSTFNGSLQASSTALFTNGSTMYATTTMNGTSPFVLGISTADLTGQTEGTIFYDSTNKVIRLYDGNNWFTVGTTTSGFTLSGDRIQLSTLATQHMSIGTTTFPAAGGSFLAMLQATSTDSIPLAIFTAKGGAQTVSAFAIYDQVESANFAINAAGQISTNLSVAGLATTTAASGNFATAGDVTATGSFFSSSTLYVSGAGTILGNVNFNDTATITAASGNFATEGTLAVGPSHVRTSLGRVIAGVCVLDTVEVSASSTAYAVCSSATGVTNGDLVLVNATSSLNADLIVQAASSTPVAGEISVLLMNTGFATGTASTKIEDSNGATASFSYWAFR